MKRAGPVKGQKAPGIQYAAGRDCVMKKLLTALLCACLSLFLCVSAFSSGIEYDEDGGIWDYTRGVYTDPSGKEYPITPEGEEGGGGSGQGEEGGSGGGAGQKQEDGAIVVESTEQGTGGMEVESGEVYYSEPDTTRAPIEGADWQALLDSVAARNGAYTPTVWIDPKTDEATTVEVVYMGIGRSCVVLNGVQQMVNTVDLKWETEAPEDMVLAVIDTPQQGYAWMREKPSTDIKTAKIKQCRIDMVVRVISTNRNWTLIDCEGTRGYVKTASLEFFANDHTEFDTGYLSVKGRTTGKDTATIKSRDKAKRRLEDCRLGMPMTIFDIVDDWAYVDIDGFFCRVDVKYVTLEKDIAAAN